MPVIENGPNREPTLSVVYVAESIFDYMDAFRTADWKTALVTAHGARDARLPFGVEMEGHAKSLEHGILPDAEAGEKPATVFELNTLRLHAVRAALRCYVYSGFPVVHDDFRDASASQSAPMNWLRQTLYPSDELIRRLGLADLYAQNTARKLGFEAVFIAGVNSWGDRRKARKLRAYWGD